MRSELLNNSLFLRYYHQWCSDPSSIVFAPIAEMLVSYGMFDEAAKVCREGLKHNPGSVAGRLALSKVLVKRGELDDADKELQRVLETMPSNTAALDLRIQISLIKSGDFDISGSESRLPSLPAKDLWRADDSAGEVPSPETRLSDDEVSDLDADSLPAWQTVTMAKIYSSQGHPEKARAIYEKILSRDPANEAALNGLRSLASS